MKTSTRIALLWPVVLISLSGCFGTIAPKPARPTQASFAATPDPLGNYQNSGVMGIRSNHLGMIWNETGRLSYDALIARGYGAHLTPPITPTNLDYGLTKYTNDPIERLYMGAKFGWANPVPNQGDLWFANPIAVDSWPSMIAVARTVLPTATATKPP